MGDAAEKGEASGLDGGGITVTFQVQTAAPAVR